MNQIIGERHLECINFNRHKSKQIIAYADDIMVIVSDKKNLQAVENITKEVKIRGLPINEEKRKYMVYNRSTPTNNITYKQIQIRRS